ncbi:hypothetical protein CAPTEDRAFT_149184 [Capitella teleta]|uniref:Protein Abitram n=1 Tax=Capitella teleta TaxID=283909 RepID=R7VL45_CAPTE|nr:hypothetical protein CAPTEDRAFT_149184 [Capitella teleta]|eukprot:ELU17295.1 hypothetical protein CAPTEDRAFT_149184 [Capitella teleta]
MENGVEKWEFTPIADLTGVPESFVDRYFTRRYKLNVKKIPGEDQCVLVHSNRLCVITIADSHPIRSMDKVVSSVNFKIDGKIDRAKNAASGKHKRGAQFLQEGSPLCHVTCTDGSRYTLYAVVRGCLVEVNDCLNARPELLSLMPETEGYIAIVMTSLKDHKTQVDALLSHEDYLKALKDRELKESKVISKRSMDEVHCEGQTEEKKAKIDNEIG